MKAKRILFRFSDEAASDEVSASCLETACECYFQHYDTANCQDGETFQVLAFIHNDALVAMVTAKCNGKGGVKDWSIKAL